MGIIIAIICSIATAVIVVIHLHYLLNPPRVSAKVTNITPEALARMFHIHYENLAPSFGYETRKETRVFDEHSNNGKLMIAVCTNILAELKKKLNK